MAEVTAKRTIAKSVQEKAAAGKCLICGENATGNRGLCTAHYMQFYRALNALPKTKRPAFEEEQIREGRILPVGKMREVRNPNPFTSEAG